MLKKQTKFKMKKICPKCKIQKNTNGFNRNAKRKGGLSVWCKECNREYGREYSKKHREARRKYYKEYSDCNKIKIRERNKFYRLTHKQEKKEYCQNNKENILRLSKKYYKEHDEELKEYRKNYYRKNKRELSKKQKEYRRLHKKDLAEYKIKYRHEHWPEIYEKIKYKRKTNIEYRIKHRLRCMLNKVLKIQHIKKVNHTMDLVGCTVKQLIKYIESQFDTKMSWDNYGQYGWHIDHIRPCASFDLTKPEEQFKCFNYKNLQPLWWPDNLSKNSYYKGKLIRKNKHEKNINYYASFK